MLWSFLFYSTLLYQVVFCWTAIFATIRPYFDQFAVVICIFTKFNCTEQYFPSNYYFNYILFGLNYDGLKYFVQPSIHAPIFLITSFYYTHPFFAESYRVAIILPGFHITSPVLTFSFSVLILLNLWWGRWSSGLRRWDQKITGLISTGCSDQTSSRGSRCPWANLQRKTMITIRRIGLLPHEWPKVDLLVRVTDRKKKITENKTETEKPMYN